MTATLAPTIEIELPEFDEELARRAYSGLSHTPEDRAKSERMQFYRHIGAVRDEMAKLAATDAQREVVKVEVEKFAQGYLTRLYAKYHADSRTFSTFIAGPSNYPARSQEKKFATARKRLEELVEFDTRGQLLIRSAVLAARSEIQAANDEWHTLRSEIERDIATVIGIDRGESYFTRSAFTTSVTGKIQRRFDNGQYALVVLALEYIRDRQQSMEKPFLSARNGIWKLYDEASKRELAPPVEALEVTSEERDGIELIYNAEIDRVQIVFPGKPDEAMRAKLRGSGWNWSPTNGAWQRKLTNAAKYSARQILGWL